MEVGALWDGYSSLWSKNTWYEISFYSSFFQLWQCEVSDRWQIMVEVSFEIKLWVFFFTSNHFWMSSKWFCGISRIWLKQNGELWLICFFLFSCHSLPRFCLQWNSGSVWDCCRCIRCVRCVTQVLVVYKHVFKSADLLFPIIRNLLWFFQFKEFIRGSHAAALVLRLPRCTWKIFGFHFF